MIEQNSVLFDLLISFTTHIHYSHSTASISSLVDIGKTQTSKPESCEYEGRPTTCSSPLLAQSSAPKLKQHQYVISLPQDREQTDNQYEMMCKYLNVCSIINLVHYKR